MILADHFGKCRGAQPIRQRPHAFRGRSGGFRGADEMVVEFEYNPTVEAPRTTSRRYTIRVQVR
jgi:hypothetical protein